MKNGMVLKHAVNRMTKVRDQICECHIIPFAHSKRHLFTNKRGVFITRKFSKNCFRTRNTRKTRQTRDNKRLFCLKRDTDF